jgi:hypothetical protein
MSEGWFGCVVDLVYVVSNQLNFGLCLRLWILYYSNLPREGAGGSSNEEAGFWDKALEGSTSLARGASIDFNRPDRLASGYLGPDPAQDLRLRCVSFTRDG